MQCHMFLAISAGSQLSVPRLRTAAMLFNSITGCAAQYSLPSSARQICHLPAGSKGRNTARQPAVTFCTPALLNTASSVPWPHTSTACPMGSAGLGRYPPNTWDSAVKGRAPAPHKASLVVWCVTVLSCLMIFLAEMGSRSWISNEYSTDNTWMLFFCPFQQWLNVKIWCRKTKNVKYIHACWASNLCLWLSSYCLLPPSGDTDIVALFYLATTVTCQNKVFFKATISENGIEGNQMAQKLSRRKTSCSSGLSCMPCAKANAREKCTSPCFSAKAIQTMIFWAVPFKQFMDCGNNYGAVQPSITARGN